MKYLERLIAAYADLLVRRPGALLVALLLVGAASVYGALQLTVNSNQLDLISQDLQPVKDVKRVVDMVGGAGHLILALRGNDEKVLKATADEVAAQLKADKEGIRSVAYKLSTQFILDRAPLFVETPDLAEVKRQGMAKLKDVIRRNSPFYIEIKETKPVEINIDAIIEKYKRVGKKNIADDYYISDDRQMVLLVIKPMWDGNELDKTGALVEKLRKEFATWQSRTLPGVRLVEDYEKQPRADGKAVTYGFAGGYKTSFDDSNEMQQSLIPTGTLSLLGVCAVLLLFLGRRLGAVILLVGGMLLGIAVTFGFAKVAVGQLNMITSILGGILMGQGIDFGIHLIYRLRHYLGQGHDLNTSVRETVCSAGVAALVSAIASAAAFFALLFSEFRGFSQFGLLAGVGTLVIGAAIFIFVPAVLLLVGRRWPGLPLAIVGSAKPATLTATGGERRVPAPWALLLGAGGLALAAAFFAPGVHFEYNTRALMVENQPSVRLQDEINARFQISADPIAVYTRTVEDAKKLWDEMNPLDRKRFSTVDQVISMYSFLPAADQQQRNVALLQAWKAELVDVEMDAIPDEHKEKYQKLLNYMELKPYTLAEVPDLFRTQFSHLPSTRPENHGYLTFVYPVVDLWDGKQMLRFADEVEVIKTKDGKEFRGAGAPILFAKLARIVLWDGKFTVALTAVLLLLILLADFRSIRHTLVALAPLGLGMGSMLGIMALQGWSLNFMNIVVFPIVLGYGVSHGVYLMHRFREGVSPVDALRTVGAAVACSTLTTLAGWAGLLSAGHKGLQSMGILACVGMAATLCVSFTIMPAVLQLMHDRRQKKGPT